MLVGCSSNNQIDDNSSDLDDNKQTETNTRYIHNKSELEDLSDDELVELSLVVCKAPESYSQLFDYNVTFTSNSASSSAEACEVTEERVTDTRYPNYTNIPTESKVVLEDDLYYVVNVSWLYQNKITYNADSICFKEEYVHFITPQPHKGITFSMEIKDFSTAQTFLDLYEYKRISKISGFSLLCSEIEDANDMYVYSNYQINTIYGDWGLRDTIKLVKRTYNISKQDGKVSFLESELIRTAYGKMN